MQTRNWFLWLLFGILGPYFTVSGQVSLHYTGPQQAVFFKLESKNLKNPLVMFGDSAGTVYFETSHEKTFLRGKPERVERVGAGLYALWKHVGGRKVEIRMIPEGPNWAISFKAIPDADILRWGFQIKAQSDEFFTGLMERVVDGPQKLSWQSGQSTALNLNGQHVEMRVKPTVSIYMPFYLSARSYGLWVQGTWPGQFDFGKAHPNR
ncbi:MAG: hypothetical protein D6814_15510, partial [Calditrichaeota bacterium]